MGYNCLGASIQILAGEGIYQRFSLLVGALKQGAFNQGNTALYNDHLGIGITVKLTALLIPPCFVTSISFLFCDHSVSDSIIPFYGKSKKDETFVI